MSGRRSWGDTPSPPPFSQPLPMGLLVNWHHQSLAGIPGWKYFVGILVINMSNGRVLDQTHTLPAPPTPLPSLPTGFLQTENFTWLTLSCSSEEKGGKIRSESHSAPLLVGLPSLNHKQSSSASLHRLHTVYGDTLGLKAFMGTGFRLPRHEEFEI